MTFGYGGESAPQPVTDVQDYSRVKPKPQRKLVVIAFRHIKQPIYQSTKENNSNNKTSGKTRVYVKKRPQSDPKT